MVAMPAVTQKKKITIRQYVFGAKQREAEKSAAAKLAERLQELVKERSVLAESMQRMGITGMLMLLPKRMRLTLKINRAARMLNTSQRKDSRRLYDRHTGGSDF